MNPATILPGCIVSEKKTGSIAMNLRRPMFALLLAIAGLGSGCRQREMQHAGPSSCPPEFETAEEFDEAPKGWMSRHADLLNREWFSAQFFDGDPRHGGVELQPKRSADGKDDFNLTWNFRPRSGQPKIWMACRYFFTSARLIRPVANEVSECSGKLYSRIRPSSVTCK